ncbi:MAG: hypothetical protein IJX76_10670 [Clostridia bacterium]|nr:hypothetical protein [Clostridia bacterium]
MIIEVQQTASSIKQEYDVYVDRDYYCQGINGRLHKYQDIGLVRNGESILHGDHQRLHWKHYIPFKYLFGSVNLSRGLELKRGNECTGSFIRSRTGFWDYFYGLSVGNDRFFRCYTRSIGSYDYVSVYDLSFPGAVETEQIALLETYLTVVDNKYKFKLYLLDEYAEDKDELIMFVLYYANYHFTERFHMSRGTTYTKAWSFSKNNQKVDPGWRNVHFPNENFFGKVDPYDLT